MQKKLFASMTLLVVVTLSIFSAVTFFVYRFAIRSDSFSEIETICTLLESNNYDYQNVGKALKNSSSCPVRLTFVEKDGSVVYDNFKDPKKLENHLERKEIAQAIEKGSGFSERRSQTLDKIYCYCAVRFDGGVLRIGKARSSLVSVAGSLIAFFVGSVGILIVVTTVMSMKLSENIMRPIRKMVKRFDFTEGEDEAEAEPEDIYEELEPIAETADKLLKETRGIVRRLKKEKEKFSLITEEMAEGMILLDSDNTVLSVNRTALKLFNPDYCPSDKLNLIEFTSEPQLLEIISELEGSPSARGLIRLNESIWRTFANKTEYGGKHGIVIILADVTESIRSEEIRREFSANVSHELKTPLTTIKGFGEMMENGIISDEQSVKRYGGTIYREASRLLLLINDIIRLSEIEDGVMPETESVNLLETACDCEEILQMKAKRADVEIKVSGENVSINAYGGYISEMILNLMDNAVKYNRQGGCVCVSIKRVKNEAVITVSDTGIGISQADCERIFERFYRVDKSRSKETGGTGLGLSIVKHLVSLYHGRIDIKSTLGTGTMITVTLPTE